MDIEINILKAKNKELQEALNIKNRALEVEAALETVRSRGMGIQRSDELTDVIKIVYEQLSALNIILDHAGFVVDYQPQQDWHLWITDKNVIPSQISHPYFENIWATQFEEAKRTNISSFFTNWNFEEKNQFYKTLLSFVPDLPQASKQFYFDCPGLSAVTAVFEDVSLYIENFDALPYTDEDRNILVRFGKVFQQTYTRFLDLQKAEMQAREAEIQLALERVRAKAMSMQTSKDLKSVALELRRQMGNLGLKELETCAIHLYDDSDEYFTSWAALQSPSGETDIILTEARLPKKGVPNLEQIIDNYSNKKKDYLIENDPENFQAFSKALKMHAPESLEVIQQTVRSQKNNEIQSYWSVSDFNGGSVLMSTVIKPDDAARKLLRRFADVFEQAYTRFLDLQKAESQAREAEIELALERVRAKAMSMQHSDHLKDVIAVIGQQLHQMGLFFDYVNFIVGDVSGGFDTWNLSFGQADPVRFLIPLTDNRLFNELIRSRKNGLEFYAHTLTRDETFQFVTHLVTNGLLKYLPEEEIQKRLHSKGMSISSAVLNEVFLSMANYAAIPYTDAENAILKRFGNAFQQAYTRFLDLEKAELQAREAQVEAALEKVRSKAMSMYKSTDLSDAASVLFDEIRKLGITFSRAGIGIISEQDRSVEFYSNAPTNDGSSLRLIGSISMIGHPEFENQYAYWKKKQNYFTALSGESLRSYYDFLSQGIHLNRDWVATNLTHYGHWLMFSDGFLFAWNDREYSVDEIAVLDRFKSVVEITFRRYYDLQKAEAQAREAKIEAALEKVRSRTLAMQRADELAETSAVLFQQLIGLGISPNRLYISIMKNDAGDSEFWLTDEDGTKVSMAYEENLHNNPTFKKMYDGWLAHKKSLVIDMQGEELREYFEHLSSIHVPFKGGLMQKRRLQYLAYFGKGFIGMASPDEQPAETLQLLERFAYVFNLTFTRFNDLQIAEAQALKAEQDLIEIKAARKKAEEALTELQATQKQLIQSEKMASLGELTAGIAHEIQNPLNFVNNFSEVSKELLDEMQEALDKGDSEEAVEIARDLMQNLEKINHHGKRADGIVKGMLQHSRASSGKAEMTNINALADEYLRLAYHGLRAKDKSFNAKLEIAFGEAIGQVSVIPQDIGRVLLNIINNAFYAVDEKQKNLENSDIRYEPLISVVTKKTDQGVEINVSDNGSGIPKQIVDKIFQPFFTTKPTGQGTGLGLSLCYDIIKAHDGSMSVETEEGNGTTFIIQLPAG